MSDSKPESASGYSLEVTEACEQALVTVLGCMGSLKDTVRLVGGLVPRYLTPESPPEVPAHAGTSDLDLVIDLAVIAAGEGSKAALSAFDHLIRQPVAEAVAA